jgi:hypothetical protein
MAARAGGFWGSTGIAGENRLVRKRKPQFTFQAFIFSQGNIGYDDFML